MRHIIDCFPFFNELDLLEIRLEELYDVVDMFVLIEAERTHSNLPKPLYYIKNQPRFSRFANKIQHCQISNEVFMDNAVANERLTFNAIKFGADALGLAKHDLVMVGCADEIVSAATVQCMKESFAHRVNVKLDNFCYYLNTQFTSSGPDIIRWPGNTIVEYKDICNIDPHRLIGERAITVGPNEVCGSGPYGWHFTFMGTEHDIYKKTRSYLHAPELTNITLDNFAGWRSRLVDPLGRENASQEFKFVAVRPLEDLPRFVRENPDKFQHLLFSANS